MERKEIVTEGGNVNIGSRVYKKNENKEKYIKERKREKKLMEY